MTHIFARQEVHGPLNVLHTDAAADMRLGRLYPDFSKEVHDTYIVAQTGGLVQSGLKGRGTSAHWVFSCPTWLVKRLLEGVEPVEAEDLLPVRSLHQGELTGVNMYLHRSLSGSVFFLLSPGASKTAGPENLVRF